MGIKSRIEQLRNLMSRKNIDAYIIFDTDPHQSEYVAEHWQSREWISGFTGSAGTVVVTEDKAGLWTDSRYYIQAEEELAGTEIELYKEQGQDKIEIEEWLNQQLNSGEVLGFNAECISVKKFRTLKNKLNSEIQINKDENLIADIWQDRPPLPGNKVEHYPQKYCGRSRRDKIDQVKEKIEEKGCQGYLISALDSIAWLLNLRGSDIRYNPVAVSYAFVGATSTVLFLNKDKLEPELKQGLEEDHIEVRPYQEIYSFLTNLDDTSIYYDPKNTNIKLKDCLPDSAQIKEGTDIVTKVKASKNATELENMRTAQIKDGVAMVKFLKWLEENVSSRNLTEWKVAEKVTEFRSQQENFKGSSFSPIVAYQENGAVVHYSPEKNNSAQIEPEGLLLIDSGGQYLEGTTDITRTIALGEPTDKQRQIFTMVLRAHINLAQAVFPPNTPAKMVESQAKQPLWKQGYDYQHGTGHGIGHYLNVHDSPGYYQIRSTFDKPLEPGMVTSNEPGCYLEDEFGVRIENVIVTKEKNFDTGEFLNFETISYCPIDTELIDVSQLTQGEIDWLNGYHREVYEKLSPYLDEQEETWLAGKTESVGV